MTFRSSSTLKASLKITLITTLILIAITANAYAHRQCRTDADPLGDTYSHPDSDNFGDGHGVSHNDANLYSNAAAHGNSGSAHNNASAATHTATTTAW